MTEDKTTMIIYDNNKKIPNIKYVEQCIKENSLMRTELDKIKPNKK